MTTDLQVRRAADVFVENDVVCLRGDAIGTGLRLAGAAWLAIGESPHRAHQRSLDHVASLVKRKLADYGLWLLAGHSVWQPDTRIVRNRKLWGSLKARGLDKPFGQDGGEGLVEAPEGVRFFEALRLGLGSLDPAVAVLEAEPGSLVAALKLSDSAVAEALVAKGWGRPSFGPSAKVMAAVCRVRGIVLWPVGAFDDREAGCVALAVPEVIETLLG